MHGGNNCRGDISCLICSYDRSGEMRLDFFVCPITFYALLNLIFKCRRYTFLSPLLSSHSYTNDPCPRARSKSWKHSAAPRWKATSTFSQSKLSPLKEQDVLSVLRVHHRLVFFGHNFCVT